MQVILDVPGTDNTSNPGFDHNLVISTSSSSSVRFRWNSKTSWWITTGDTFNHKYKCKYKWKTRWGRWRRWSTTGSTCWSVATSRVFSSTLGTFFQGWPSKTFCLKLYICWFLNCFLFCPREGLAGKDGVTYSQHGALCLETQVLICIISQRVRFWTAKSSKKSAFFRTKKSAFAKKKCFRKCFF